MVCGTRLMTGRYNVITCEQFVEVFLGGILLTPKTNRYTKAITESVDRSSSGFLSLECI